MDLQVEKYKLIEYIMGIQEPDMIEKLKELLLDSATKQTAYEKVMQEVLTKRALASEHDIEAGNVISMEEFSKDNKEWLKAQYGR